MTKLHLRFTQPGCVGFYWHCRKRKKFRVIDAPKREFMFSLWPGKGLTFQTACDATGVARKIRSAGRYSVECGTYFIEAYWKTDDKNPDAR